MENTNSYEQEINSGLVSRLHIKTEAVINMMGVILFYVIVFVAFSVFTSQV